MIQSRTSLAWELPAYGDQPAGVPFTLYVLRCALYYASTDDPDPELLQWWNWKDKDAWCAELGSLPARVRLTFVGKHRSPGLLTGTRAKT